MYKTYGILKIGMICSSSDLTRNKLNDEPEQEFWRVWAWFIFKLNCQQN